MSNNAIDIDVLRQVCKEMGIPWDTTLTEAIIDGQPASEYFKKHELFEEDSTVTTSFFGEEPIDEDDPYRENLLKSHCEYIANVDESLLAA